MDDKDAPKVWWMEASSVDGNEIYIDPHFKDMDLHNHRLEDMGEMGYALSSFQPFPQRYVPDELRWMIKDISDSDRALPDAFFSISRALVVSEAMRDALSAFELGSSQFFECPLFEIKEKDKLDRTEADRSKQDPRRWFVLHVSETKKALVPEKSKGLNERPKSPGVYRLRPTERPTVALSKDIALNGPHIWKQKGLSGVFFFTNTILSAIKANGLRTHAMKFIPCRLV